MVKKVLALAAVLLVATMGVARADYPTPLHIIVVVESTLVPGGPITVDAQVFDNAASVSFTINGETTTVPLGMANASSAGLARFAGLIPAGTAPGTYTLTAVGRGTDGKTTTITLPVRVSALANGPATVAGITVERPAGSVGHTGSLPRSGSSATLPLTQVGLAAVAVGGLLTLVANRRRSNKLRAGV